MPAPNPLASPLPWNLVTAGYARDIAPFFTNFATRALELAQVKAGQHVVDVACGPGTLAFEAARWGAQVSALDFSESMIAQLHEQAQHAQISGISAVVGDGMQLPYPDATFDAGFSMFGLIFFPDRARGLAELLRVLKPGRPAVIASWVPLDRAPLWSSLFRAIGKLLPDLPLGSDAAPMTTPDECISEMTAAGFSQVACREATFTLDASSLTAFLAAAERTNAPLALLKHTLPESRWRELWTGLEQILLAEFGAGPLHMQLTALLSIGHKSAY